MKIVNNTNQTITLVNGKKLTKYKTLILNEPSEELIEQVENLAKKGLVQVFS